MTTPSYRMNIHAETAWASSFTLTLNVIIECAVSVTVALQQLKCVVVGKVFKLNQCMLTKSTTAT